MSEHLTIEEIDERIGRVEAAVAKRDYETAHIEEDDLLIVALKAIRDGAPNYRDIAASALRVTDLQYDHWFA